MILTRKRIGREVYTKEYILDSLLYHSRHRCFTDILIPKRKFLGYQP